MVTKVPLFNYLDSKDKVSVYKPPLKNGKTSTGLKKLAESGDMNQSKNIEKGKIKDGLKKVKTTDTLVDTDYRITVLCNLVLKGSLRDCSQSAGCGSPPRPSATEPRGEYSRETQ